ncbi:AraC family transcriptional regulator [Bifidobacterium eulemuris]|uniref:AraC family transcriptional regulator n=1 Tax=Bifidobacterium eulemuris TaxID=1765219 RepID=A0A261G7P5_9BIFI|nr:AraC family transcriptional regulator [Bifidobacterium eulemuris]OZG67451.1 AraC family transcriptional regulator [Bifidobacterium eulemuris]
MDHPTDSSPQNKESATQTDGGDVAAALPLIPVAPAGRLPTGAEVVRYDGPMFFSFTEHSLLSQYPHMRAECHWHVDFEFLHVIRGSMRFFVNGDVVRLDEGQGIFVNSRQLHYGFDLDGRDCEFACTLLNPLRFGVLPQLTQRYIAPLMENRRLPYLVIEEGREEGRRILATLDQLLKSRVYADELSPLTVASGFYALVRDVLALSQTARPMDGAHPHLAALSAMVEFVHGHYDQPITLAQIAEAGSLGRTACTTVFRRYLDLTPIEFVTDVRVRAAARLLTTTALPVNVIASRTGFASVSFFTRTFRTVMDATPSQYRRQSLDDQAADASEGVMVAFHA